MSPPKNITVKLEDGIYEVSPGKEWLVQEDGKEQRFRSSDGYNFTSLLRTSESKSDKVPYRGSLDGDRNPLPPSRGLAGAFTGSFSVSGYDANGNRIPGYRLGDMFFPAKSSGHSSPNLERIDALLERTREIIKELDAKKKG